MKIRLTIDLDIPDECRDWSDAALRQGIFDDYVNYNTIAHATAAVDWCKKAKVGTPEERPTEKLIFEHHKLWTEITTQPKWTLERLD